MNSFRDIIQAFGGGASLAREISEKPVTVRAWGRRDSIPPDHWCAIERAAKAKRIKGVTVGRMAELAATERAA